MKTNLTIWAVLFLLSGCDKSNAIEDASPTVAQPAQQQVQVHKDYVRAGAIVCLKQQSFYKVSAMERVGSMANLPDDCGPIGTDIEVNVLRIFSDPVAGNLAMVGNSGGSVIVRQRDLR